VTVLRPMAERAASLACVRHRLEEGPARESAPWRSDLPRPPHRLRMFRPGQHLHRQTLWLRSVAGLARSAMPRQRAAEKGPARPSAVSRKWTPEPTRRAVRDGRTGPESNGSKGESTEMTRSSRWGWGRGAAVGAVTALAVGALASIGAAVSPSRTQQQTSSQSAAL
jgi:hypothetical protein